MVEPDAATANLAVMAVMAVIAVIIIAPAMMTVIDGTTKGDCQSILLIHEVPASAVEECWRHYGSGSKSTETQLPRDRGECLPLPPPLIFLFVDLVKP